MPKRPELNISLTSTDKLMEGAGWLTLLLLWAITLIAYTHLPEIIPTHFNASGQADNEGSKMTLLLLPVIGTMIFIGMTLLTRYPHLFNYPTEITDENAQRQYTNATRMIRYLKLSTAFIFTAIVFMLYQSVITGSGSIGAWFLPVMIIIVILPLGYFTFQAIRKK